MAFLNFLVKLFCISFSQRRLRRRCCKTLKNPQTFGKELAKKNERKPVKIQFRIPDPSLDITGIKGGEVRKED